MGQQTVRKGRTHALCPERAHMQRTASSLRHTGRLLLCYWHEILAREGNPHASPARFEDASDPLEDS